MLDKPPARTPPAAKLIACPPRRQAKPADPCAMVIFGATGDLAYKQIFPALQALVKRHNLDIPIVGVAKAGWDLDGLKEGGLRSADVSRLDLIVRWGGGPHQTPIFSASWCEIG